VHECSWWRGLRALVRRRNRCMDSPRRLPDRRARMEKRLARMAKRTKSISGSFCTPQSADDIEFTSRLVFGNDTNRRRGFYTRDNDWSVPQACISLWKPKLCRTGCLRFTDVGNRRLCCCRVGAQRTGATLRTLENARKKGGRPRRSVVFRSSI